MSIPRFADSERQRLDPYRNPDARGLGTLAALVGFSAGIVIALIVAVIKYGSF